MNYYKVLDHGFVGLVDSLGSDELVEQFARVSYRRGTRKKSDTTKLINYLVKNSHSSPLESGEIVFHIGMPLFIVSQFVRHRTQSLNISSHRYSIAPDLFYYPEYSRMRTQHEQNKQSSSEVLALSPVEYEHYMYRQTELNLAQLEIYHQMLERGVAREIARIHLPQSLYTTLFCKFDLRNLLHYLNLRAKSNAQWEHQQYAHIMGGIAKQLFPITFQAWIDHIYNGEITFELPNPITKDQLELIKE
jgi:thymidylate synthase (FAD)